MKIRRAAIETTAFCTYNHTHNKTVEGVELLFRRIIRK